MRRIAAPFAVTGLLLASACDRGTRPPEPALTEAAEPAPASDPVTDALDRAGEALAEAPRAFDLRLTADGEERRGRLLLASPGPPRPRLRLVWRDAEGDTVIVSDGERVGVARPGGERLTSSWARVGTVLFPREAGKLVSPAIDPSAFADYRPQRLEDEALEDEVLQRFHAPLPNGGGWSLAIAASDGLPRRVSFQAAPDAEPEILELTPIDEPVPEAIETYRLADGGSAEEYYAGPRPGDEAPAASFELAGGETVSLADLRGSAVVLDFWATWCIPCRPAMRHLQELYKELGDDGLEVFGLRWLDSGDPTAYLDSLGVTYPTGDGSPLVEPYAVSTYGLPTVYVLDRDGRVVDAIAGYTEGTTERQVREAVETALRPM